MSKEKDDTRRAILAAAKTEFAEKGFSGARMSSIAEKAGANQALIHYYFGSKEKLYSEVLASLFGPEKLCSGEEIPAAEWNLSIPQKLYIIVYFMTKIRLQAYDEEGHRIFHWEIAEGQKFLRAFAVKFIEPRMNMLKKIIEQGVENGEFSVASPFLTVSTLFLLIMGLEKSPSLFKGTKMGEEFGSPDHDRLFFDHVITTIFKMLAPDGKPAVIPEIPDELRAFLDECVDQIAKDRDSEFNCQIVSKFLSLLKTTI